MKMVPHYRWDWGNSSAEVLLVWTEKGIFTRAFNPVKFEGFPHICPKAGPDKILLGFLICAKRQLIQSTWGLHLLKKITVRKFYLNQDITFRNICTNFTRVVRNNHMTNMENFNYEWQAGKH